MRYYRITMCEGERTAWNGFSKEEAIAKMDELKGAGFATLEEYEVPEALIRQSHNPLLTAGIAVRGRKPISEQRYVSKSK